MKNLGLALIFVPLSPFIGLAVATIWVLEEIFPNAAVFRCSGAHTYWDDYANCSACNRKSK